MITLEDIFFNLLDRYKTVRAGEIVKGDLHEVDGTWREVGSVILGTMTISIYYVDGHDKILSVNDSEVIKRG